MKFLANENFPFPSIKLLRSKGFDVKSIAEDNYGIPDSQVISIAQANDQIILTFDSDYGELIYRYGVENPPAVIYFRDKGIAPLFAGETLLYLINENTLDFEKAFTVVEANNVRQRKYSS